MKIITKLQTSKFFYLLICWGAIEAAASEWAWVWRVEWPVGMPKNGLCCAIEGEFAVLLDSVDLEFLGFELDEGVWAACFKAWSDDLAVDWLVGSELCLDGILCNILWKEGGVGCVAGLANLWASLCNLDLAIQDCDWWGSESLLETFSCLELNKAEAA